MKLSATIEKIDSYLDIMKSMVSDPYTKFDVKQKIYTRDIFSRD